MMITDQGLTANEIHRWRYLSVWQTHRRWYRLHTGEFAELRRSDRSLTYKLNSTGPSTEPWGAPNLRFTVLEALSSIWTNCLRSVK